jgi:predicted methyltransferase
MTQRSRIVHAIAAAAMALVLTAPARGQDQLATDSARLVRTLKLTAGQTVADIGAGGGQISVALARTVGPSGRVYATELNTTLLPMIRRAAEAAALTNVVLVEGHATRTNLPGSCCDALVVRYVYHHFREPRPMNESLRQSLKPGGLIAVIDFAPDSTESVDPAGRAGEGKHGVGAATVVCELREAGFELVSAEPGGMLTGSVPTGFMVVMRRPEVERAR